MQGMAVLAECKCLCACVLVCVALVVHSASSLIGSDKGSV